MQDGSAKITLHTLPSIQYMLVLCVFPFFRCGRSVQTLDVVVVIVLTLTLHVRFFFNV